MFGRRIASPGNTKVKRKTSTPLTSNCCAIASPCSTRRFSWSAISTATSSAPISMAPSRKRTSSPMSEIDSRDIPAVAPLRSSTIPGFLKPQRTTAAGHRKPGRRNRRSRPLASGPRTRSSWPMPSRARSMRRRATQKSAHRPVPQSHCLLLLRRRHRPAPEKCSSPIQEPASMIPPISPNGSKNCFAVHGERRRASARRRFAFQRPSFRRRDCLRVD